MISSPFFIVLKRLRYPLILIISVYAILILGFTLIPGRDDQGNVWYMSFFHAFYFVSFMGSTIGFGEIPYAFTDAQRLWAIFGIFSSVISWIYSIGSLLAILKEPGFQNVLTETRFQRSVRQLKRPFYVICGYGDTGKLLAHSLTELNIQTVVLDNRQARIEALDVNEQDLDIPALCANAIFPENLRMAGLQQSYCQGVIALTNDDQVNLKIMITAKLLNEKLLLISRANTREVMANMASFDTRHILNPFEIFARSLALAIRSPGAYLLHDWFTNAEHNLMQEPPYLPGPGKAPWLLCGYGRFGKAVARYLRYEGIKTTIIEADPELTQAPVDCVVGSGTEAVTLKQAGIQKAGAVIAGTDNDSNNLSIIITAKELVHNRSLYTIARQNFHRNQLIYENAGIDLVMQPSNIIAREILAIIKAPLLNEFLKQVRRQKNSWINLLISRISAVFDTEIPDTWSVNLSTIESYDVKAFVQKHPVSIADLMRNPRNRKDRLCCIPLMIKSRLKHKNKPILLPSEDQKISIGDTILFCGERNAKELMLWTVNNINTLQYVVMGEQYSRGYIWNLIAERVNRS